MIMSCGDVYSFKPHRVGMNHFSSNYTGLVEISEVECRVIPIRHECIGIEWNECVLNEERSGG